MMQPPDFIITGWQDGGRTWLMASTSLTEVEIRSEHERDRWGHHPDDLRSRYFITVEMRKYVTVVADTYPEAFELLFKLWDPVKRREIGTQRAIEQ